MVDDGRVGCGESGPMTTCGNRDTPAVDFQFALVRVRRCGMALKAKHVAQKAQRMGLNPVKFTA
jgi:hypothetical protein